MVTLAAPAPAAAGNECLSIVLTGAPGTTIFVDGFEGGSTAAWSAPVLPTFSLVATDDLGVAVAFDASLAGDHLLELRWFLPGDALYQSVATPFTAGALESGGSRFVAGYPFPVAVVAAWRNLANVEAPDDWLVNSALPVAGPSITDADLQGDWRVEAYLDGSETQCGAPRPFRLEP